MNFKNLLKYKSDSTQYWTQSIFWLVFLALGAFMISGYCDFWHSLLWSAGNTLFFFVSVNLNLHYLLPKFMLKNSILIYLAFLIGLALLLTPFITLFNIWILDNYPGPIPKSLGLPYFHFINLVIVTALSSLVRIPLDWLKMQSEKSELLTRNIETELQSLKNQINPHFLFNTLNNLYALTLKKSDQAPEVVLKLSDMMRYMLYECNEKEVSMEKEFEYIKNYIELEKLRTKANSEIKIFIDEALLDKNIAPLLLIPFVENSFKHGYLSSLKDSYIHIDANLAGEFLLFSVENSKTPSLPAQLSPKIQGGVGLVNVKKRLNLIYPNRHELKVKDEPDIYSILLKIKLT